MRSGLDVLREVDPEIDARSVWCHQNRAHVIVYLTNEMLDKAQTRYIASPMVALNDTTSNFTPAPVLHVLVSH